MKKVKELYLNMAWEKKILWTAFALSIFPIAAGALWRGSAPEPLPRERQAEVETFIPKGFVLVPIEVQNYEALDSILGPFGVVDLFQSAGFEKPQQRLVARNVRILRAPQNPSHFAILVAENAVGGILKSGAPFFVIVKHPDGNSGTEFVNDKSSAKRSIVYDRE